MSLFKTNELGFVTSPHFLCEIIIQYISSINVILHRIITTIINATCNKILFKIVQKWHVMHAHIFCATFVALNIVVKKIALG